MAKFASGYIASGNVPSVIAELLTDAENVKEKNYSGFKQLGRGAENYIFLSYFM